MTNAPLAHVLVIEFILKRLMASHAQTMPGGVAAGILDNPEAVIASLCARVAQQDGEGQAALTEEVFRQFLEDVAQLADR